MKYYDFNKAVAIIEQHKENLKEASMGMHEDWFGLPKPCGMTVCGKSKFPKIPKN